ncbi:MAG: hypothetical protein ACOH2M_19965 [Cypionkella sp.]
MAVLLTRHVAPCGAACAMVKGQDFAQMKTPASFKAGALAKPGRPA